MIDWFQQYYDLTSREDGALIGKGLHEIIRWSMDHRTVDEAAAKNDELCDVVLARLDTQLVIALLRSTFHIRQLLECWPDKLDEAHLILTSRGFDSSKILRGLKKVAT